VSSPALARFVGERRNLGPGNNASWILAVGILAVVIPANDKISRNEVFFAAHGVSVLAWVVLLLLGLALVWLILTGVLRLVRSQASAAVYDAVASLLMLLVSWFFVGNMLARAVFPGAPAVGAVVGLIVAAGLTWLARRFHMGNILVVFAAAAAALPLVGTLFGGSAAAVTTSSITFDGTADRPNVLWVVSDELSYFAAFDQDGNVRPGLPNLAELASGATTYTHAYASANYTDYAVPSMLSGITDVSARGYDAMQKVRAGVGITPAMASAYSVVMQSPIYSFDCSDADCAAVGNGDEGVVQRYWNFAKDTAAIAGKTALAAPFSDFFPSLDGKWRDFWSGGDEFGSNAEGETYQAMVAGLDQVTTTQPDRPFFGFWHTIRTHAPWVVDGDGKQIYPFRVPVVAGAHMIGAEANQAYTTDDLKRLERRLWSFSVKDFDRQLGEVVDALKASGHYDDTMIVVTADHGATMTEGSDRRVGDTLVQRWSEVAHVPLVVKASGQTAPEKVTAPRSTGQIAQSVVDAAGGTASPDLHLSPSLAQDADPVFTTVNGGVLTPYRYDGIAEVDPWLPEDLNPTNATYPFAVGIDQGLLGQPVPSSWTQIRPTGVQVLPGDSDEQVVVVDRARAACTDGTAGLVSAGGTVIGSVLWEGPKGSTTDSTRGWAIVPKHDPADYAFWCPAG
jgi:hypothetical protein